MPTSVRVCHAVGKVIGEPVGDRLGLLNKFLPSADDRSWRCVCFIDVYGDTRFNRLQLDDVLEELERLRGRSPRPEWQDLLDQIRSLALLAQSRPMYFLEFIGD